MKQNYSILAIIAAIILTGCGSNGGQPANGASNDPFKIQKVEYTLRGSKPPLCKNASDVTTSTAKNDDDLGYQSCSWYCGEYEGSMKSVSLSFVQDGKNGIWKFDDDIVSTPSSLCHK